MVAEKLGLAGFPRKAIVADILWKSKAIFASSANANANAVNHAADDIAIKYMPT